MRSKPLLHLWPSCAFAHTVALKTVDGVQRLAEVCAQLAVQHPLAAPAVSPSSIIEAGLQQPAAKACDTPRTTRRELSKNFNSGKLVEQKIDWLNSESSKSALRLLEGERQPGQRHSDRRLAVGLMYESQD